MSLEKIAEFNEALRSRGLTIVCAESITAGLLASEIASVSGASDVLKGSIVTYSRDFKSSILGVDPRIIDKYTAESIQTTTEMTYGLVKIYPNAHIHVSVTGIASPSTPNYKVNEKEGKIYVSVYYKNTLFEKEEVIEGKERNEIRMNTVYFILDLISDIIKKTN